MSAALLITSVVAGNVTLAWDPYTSDASVDTIKVYVTRGTNAVFTAGNANAVLTRTTSVANTSLTVSNLTSGAWTFVATAICSTNNLESDNSNTAWTNVFPGSPKNIRVTTVVVP